MGESIYNKLQRVGGCRTHLTYESEGVDTETGRGCVVVHDLPFVVGVVADLSGDPAQPLKRLEDRKFIAIDRDNFNEVVAHMTPGLNFEVENLLEGDGSELPVQLKFNSMADFEPQQIVRRLPLLSGVSFHGVGDAERLQIDKLLSRQLAAILHHPKFLELEGTWRGLHYLVQNSETSAALKLKVLNVSKRELFRDLDRATEFDQTIIYKKLYENEFLMPGGEPYGALVGDYQFTNHPEDIEMLSKMSQVATAAFCPFIAAASPKLFGHDDFIPLVRRKNLEIGFSDISYVKWNSYRDSEDSRFVVLTLPRVLSRLPYGSDTSTIAEFAFEEFDSNDRGEVVLAPNVYLPWMSAAWVMAVRLTDAFAKWGTCVSICGAEHGGKVENLPARLLTPDDEKLPVRFPTEILIHDRLESQLSQLGFLPLCHVRSTDSSVFVGGQTTQRFKQYDRPDATANAVISAWLPYIMATSRFAHYIMCIARDKCGSFMGRQDMEDYLNHWIRKYVCPDPQPSADMKRRYPLASAHLTVEETPGRPGSYNAVAGLRPWLPMRSLTVGCRMVVKLPCRF